MNVAALDNAREILSRVRESKAALVSNGRLIKVGELPMFNPVPHSSLTAVSDFIANRKYAPQLPNPLTSDEQALIERLLAGMSKSRARVVDTHRRARQSSARLKQLFAASGLWG